MCSAVLARVRAPDTGTPAKKNDVAPESSLVPCGDRALLPPKPPLASRHPLTCFLSPYHGPNLLVSQKWSCRARVLSCRVSFSRVTVPGCVHAVARYCRAAVPGAGVSVSLSAHLPGGVWVVSSFWLLQIKLLCKLMHTSLCTDVSFHCLGKPL